MCNPAELIQLLATVSDRVFIWAHYFDRALSAANANLTHRFPDHLPANCAGFEHTLYRYEYQDALGWTDFCGGTQSYSTWISRSDNLNCLMHFGYNDVRISFDHPAHPHGPAIALIATRLAVSSRRHKQTVIYVLESHKTLRQLIDEAILNFRRGGLGGLTRATAIYFKRWIKRYVYFI